MGRPFDELSKLNGEVVRKARLDEECRAAFALRAFAHPWRSLAGYDHDRNAPRSGVALHALKKVPPIAMRERQFGHNNVRA